MNSSYRDFLHDILAAESAEASYGALCKVANDFGFDKIIYLFTPDPDDSFCKPTQFTTYAPEWMEYWAVEGYAEIDIGVRKTAEQGLNALAFDVDKFVSEAPKDEDPNALNALWEANREAGCGKIFSHQLFQHQVGKGAMGLVSSQLTSRDFKKTVDEYGVFLSSIIP